MGSFNISQINLSDIAALTVVLLCAAWGFKRGFVRSVLGLGSIIISLVLALVLYPVVSGFMTNSVIGQYVSENVSGALVSSEKNPDSLSAEEANRSLKMPSGIAAVIENGISSAKDSVMTSVTNGVTSTAINIISMIAVFLLVRLIMWLLSMLLDALTKLPVISSVNKLLGGALGIASGILAVYILLAAVTFVAAVNSSNKIVNNVLESSVVSGMYNENFILDIIGKKEAEN